MQFLLRPVLHKLAIVILRQQFKTFDSNHFTLSCFNVLFPKCMAHKTKSCVYLALFHIIFIHFIDLIRSQLSNFFNVAKCNSGKVNLELMLPAVSPGLHMICGGTPLEFTGANYIQPCSLAIIVISAFVSESLRIHQPLLPFPEGYLTSELSIRLGKYFHWTSFSVMVSVSGCYWGGSRLPGCHGDLPAVPKLPRAPPRQLLRHQFPSSSIGEEFKTIYLTLVHLQADAGGRKCCFKQ